MSGLLISGLQRFFGQLLWHVLVSTLRGSLIFSGCMMLVSSSGTWKYLASSFFAHDLQRAVAWESVDMSEPRVALVAINDTAYDGYFGGRSPLDRGRLLEMLKALDASAGSAKGIVIDLDLAPLPGQEQKELFEFLARKPARWVLAEPILRPADDTPTRMAWRTKLCQAGIRMGLPYLPTEYGYVSGSHQYRGSLTDVALNPNFDCNRLKNTVQSAMHADGSMGLIRYSAPMSGGYVKQGWVVPFDGNLVSMKQTITAVQPQWVVLGGMWGTGDVLNSPLGERYGVQLHAAALDGQLLGEVQVAYTYQIVAAWLTLTVISFVLTLAYQSFRLVAYPWFETHSGHRFLMNKVWPVVCTILVFCCLMGVSEILAVVHARWHWWIPTATIAGSVFGYLLFVWNWGLKSINLQTSVGTTFLHSTMIPLKEDWSSAQSAFKRVWQGSAAVIPSSGGESLVPTMTRSRAAVECFLAAVSLVVQTVLPLAALFFALNKTL
jgi:CHASE2 domain-containing sensor protein